MEKVKVVQESCIGCGACVAIAPEVFEMNDDGFAQVKENFDFTNISSELEKDVLDAVDGCPTGAIVIEK